MILIAFSLVFSLGNVVEAKSPKKVKSVTLKVGKKNVTKKTYVMKPNKTKQLKVLPSPKKAVKSITYSSGNKRVIQIDKKGKMTSWLQGVSKITIKVKGKNGKVKKTYVTVRVRSGKIYSNFTKNAEKISKLYPDVVKKHVDWINEERKVHGVAPLKYSADLSLIAGYRAEECSIGGGAMMETGTGSHMCHLYKDATLAPLWVDAQYYGFGCQKENLMKTYSDTLSNEEMFEHSTHYKLSEGHYKNIIDKQYKEVGVAFYVANGTTMCVEVFK